MNNLMKKKIVFLTGAGVSKESGLAIFRGNNGMWNNYKIDEVASTEGWNNNPELVLNFYNERRTVGMQILLEELPNFWEESHEF